VIPSGHGTDLASRQPGIGSRPRHAQPRKPAWICWTCVHRWHLPRRGWSTPSSKATLRRRNASPWLPASTSVEGLRSAGNCRPSRIANDFHAARVRGPAASSASRFGALGGRDVPRRAVPVSPWKTRPSGQPLPPAAW